jgi:hypothetical protein
MTPLLTSILMAIGYYFGLIVFFVLLAVLASSAVLIVYFVQDIYESVRKTFK